MEKFVEALKQKIRSKEGLSPKMQDILDACVVLFSTKGFSNTSTKDIAKAANVAEGTIYKHFGTKENLLYATIFPILRDIISTLPDDQQALLSLRYGDGLSYEELSETLGVELGTVKSKLSRAKERLRSLVRNL